ncbi:MAG: heavy metal-binding domain-containing protein, partial [Patescibacteria group bacterium]
MKEIIYTCPMHPEVKSDKPGKCPKCGGMDLVEKREDGKTEEHDHSMMMTSPDAAQNFLRRFFIVTFLLLPLFVLSNPGKALFGYSEFSIRHYLELAVATVIFYFGFIFFQHAKHEITSRKYGMMTLVSLAVGAGYLFSAVSTFLPNAKGEFYLEISTLIWVLLFGHFLEARSSSAAGNALQEVAKLLPKEAHLLHNGHLRDVVITELQEGDVVRVLPGEKTPADGIIIKGGANFNEAHISGESKPIKKSMGDKVIAGAICMDGSVDVKLEKVGENSTIGQIKKLISSAQQTKPSAQRLADKASRWLTFIALGTAVLTVGVWAFIIGQSFVFAMTL